MFYESFLCESQIDEHIPPEFYEEDDTEFTYDINLEEPFDYDDELWYRR